MGLERSAEPVRNKRNANPPFNKCRGPMVKLRSSLILAGALVAVLSVEGVAQSAGSSAETARDWTTWGYDQERSGWNRGESVLTPQNVSRLTLKWDTQVSTVPKDVVMSTLTAPLVVEARKRRRERGIFYSSWVLTAVFCDRRR